MEKRSRVGWYKVELKPSVHPTLLDIAWAAGIFEGEGHARGGRTHPGGGKDYTTYVCVTQKHPWLCFRLKALFGGTVYTYKHKYKETLGEYHRWVLSGPRARGFLMTVYKFLSPENKARQALEAIK